MTKEIPKEIAPFIQEYVQLLHSNMPEDTILGIYLYGSISLGAYQVEKSDIDYICILKREMTKQEINKLKSLHSALKSNPLLKRLDGIYITEDSIGKYNEQLQPYPYCSEGKIKIGHWDINGVTWWLLKYYGIKLYGVHTNELNIHVNWTDITDYMKYNINHYWLKKSKQQLLFLTDEMVEFGILTICRIICTLEYEEILAKKDAVERVMNIVPQHWHPLLKEGLRIRTHSNTPSLYQSRFKRAKDCTTFILFVHDLCRKKYFQSFSEQQPTI